MHLYDIKNLYEFEIKNHKIRLKQGEPIEHVQTLLRILDEGPYTTINDSQSFNNNNTANFDIKKNSLPYGKGAKIDTVNLPKELPNQKLKGIQIRNIQHRENTIAKSSNSQDKSMTLRGLKQFLEVNGMYPTKYRSTIWRYLLSLPDNAINFNDYIRMGTHHNFLNFVDKFPLASDQLCNRMVRVLSVFAHYSPVFGDTTFTPIT